MTISDVVICDVAMRCVYLCCAPVQCMMYCVALWGVMIYDMMNRNCKR